MSLGVGGVLVTSGSLRLAFSKLESVRRPVWSLVSREHDYYYYYYYFDDGDERR
jgi:hypothetical protein